jgi:hypothetical protein
MRLRKGMFFVSRDEQGGSFYVDRTKLLDICNVHEGKLVFLDILNCGLPV